MGIYLVRFDGHRGVVKCNHIEKENTIKLLKSIKKISSYNISIETLGTSGTIKALIRKHMIN
jgi:RNase P/RNase MRP subunit POP5